MDVLTSALWRGIFKGDESIKEPHVRVLAEYIDSELADIYAVDVVSSKPAATVHRTAYSTSPANKIRVKKRDWLKIVMLVFRFIVCSCFSLRSAIFFLSG